MQYREFAPRPELTSFVDCLWTLQGYEPGVRRAEAVLPDGRPEIILHMGDPFERLDPGGLVERQPRVLYAGQLRGQLLLRPGGHIAVLGVRFHPHGAAGVLRIPQHELAGSPIALDALSTPLGRALTRVQNYLPRALSLVQDVIAGAIDRSRIDARIVHAVTTIRRTRGRVAVDELARGAGLTRRHLERRFLDSVGVTPKRLARIARFQHALQMLEREDSARLGTETAAACGYADQSHFIRDFRRLAGCSPGEHLIRQGELTGFFIAARS